LRHTVDGCFVVGPAFRAWTRRALPLATPARRVFALRRLRIVVLPRRALVPVFPVALAGILRFVLLFFVAIAMNTSTTGSRHELRTELLP